MRWLNRLSLIVHLSIPLAIAARQVSIRFWIHDPDWGQIELLVLVFVASTLHAGAAFGWWSGLGTSAAVSLLTFGIEWMGTATGIPFGSYRYSAALGPRVGGVPIVVPLTWFGMSYAAWRTGRLLLERRPGDSSGRKDPGLQRGTVPARSDCGADTRGLSGVLPELVVTGALMTLWDAMMDLNQVRSGRWTWSESGAWFGIPARNFGGWFLTAALAGGVIALVARSRNGGGAAPARRSAFAIAPVGLYFLFAWLALIKVALTGQWIPVAVVGPIMAALLLATGFRLRMD